MAAVIQGRLSGQTFAEVGAEMGFSSSAAHKWETKARRLLRAQMSPACVVPAK
jgi:DNA-directed RNA polymerase specialized sigma24 family protein